MILNIVEVLFAFQECRDELDVCLVHSKSFCKYRFHMGPAMLFINPSTCSFLALLQYAHDRRSLVVYLMNRDCGVIPFVFFSSNKLVASIIN